MIRIVNSLLVAGGALMFATTVQAAVSYGASNAGEAYAGIKAGQFDVNITSTPKVLGYGVYGGYHFDQSFGAELDYLTSQNKAYGNGLTVNAKSYGVYGTYRYALVNSPVYAKGKLGIAKTQIHDRANDGSYTKRVNEVGLAGAVGVGFKVSDKLAAELGYQWQGGDARILGLSAHLLF